MNAYIFWKGESLMNYEGRTQVLNMIFHSEVLVIK
jgi:hypothetical protein